MQSPFKIPGVLFSATAASIQKSRPNGAKKLDLAIVKLSKNTQTAAVFTQNIFAAAPVIVAKNHRKNPVRAFIINSGNANAGTGKSGILDAEQTCKMTARALGIQPAQVLPFSTGVIGKSLPVGRFENGIEKLAKNLGGDQLPKFAKSILTTDTHEKIAVEKIKAGGKIVTIGAVAKGAGMICPNMATMLCFIFSDISATRTPLQNCLKIAVGQSFNRITVDGDTSTNDACALSATGKSGVRLSTIAEDFQNALNKITRKLARMIVKDGEGATKFVEISVRGGSAKNCRKVADTIAHSPLVKTALFASDANWGRILAAVGRAGVRGLQPENVDIYLGKTRVVSGGVLDSRYTEKKGAAEMAKKEISIIVKIGKSETAEKIWTTDLSLDYIKINADYRS